MTASKTFSAAEILTAKGSFLEVRFAVIDETMTLQEWFPTMEAAEEFADFCNELELEKAAAAVIKGSLEKVSGKGSSFAQMP